MLASDQPAPMPTPDIGDRQQRHTVLVVAADADVRRHVRECLRDRVDLHVLDAPTVAIAEQLAAAHRPHLLIVDPRDAAVLSAIADVRAVVLMDDVPPHTRPNDRIVTLMRPFGRHDLEALVDQALS